MKNGNKKKIVTGGLGREGNLSSKSSPKFSAEIPNFSNSLVSIT